MNNNVQTVNHLEVNFNDEGYLIDFDQWNIEVGEKIAETHNIELSETHWDILSWIQEQFKTKRELSMKSLLNTGISDLNELKQLFTCDPLTVSTKIAGIPNQNNNTQS